MYGTRTKGGEISGLNKARRAGVYGVRTGITFARVLVDNGSLAKVIGAGDNRVGNCYRVRTRRIRISPFSVSIILSKVLSGTLLTRLVKLV